MIEKLKRLLTTRESELVGCTRRNRLAHDLPVPWRFMRGNSLLAVLAMKIRMNTPIGEIDVFYEAPDLLAFRGGTWKPWWNEDFRLLAAIALLYLSGNVRGVHVFQELDGELSERYVDAPSLGEAQGLVQDALEKWRAFARIPKNGPRGFASCPHCPVKRACDALDLEQGATNDWPVDYTAG